MVDSRSIQDIGSVLEDGKKSLSDRFRALFTLKNLGGKDAIKSITRCFSDPSALLKHELAYCLGQMQDKYAIPALVDVLEDKRQEPMVRHEAGEALGAIGCESVLPVLQKYSNDPVLEVAETCQLAVGRIEWLHHGNTEEMLSANPYSSVDPAPPKAEVNVSILRNTLLDETKPLFERYRAMFSLRNSGTNQAVLALAEGLKCRSALFRHEIAYVLGQMQNTSCVEQLAANLADVAENPMVRHECAEALGSIATDQCTDVLRKYLQDKERVVKESCVVALDMSEYENSDQFQYANGLKKLENGKQL